MGGSGQFLTKEEVKDLLRQSGMLDFNCDISASGSRYSSEETGFLFQDLVKLDGRALQFILQRTIAAKEIYVICRAIRQESQEFRDKILLNLSKRMREEIKKELIRMGEINKEEVANAQQIIVELVKHHAKQGEILLGF